MVCPSCAQCAMQPPIVICWLVYASTLRVRPGTSDAQPTADQPEGRPETLVEFDGAAAETVGLAAWVVAVTEAETGLAMATLLCLKRLNAQEPPQVLPVFAAQGMLHEDAARALPLPFWKELPPRGDMSETREHILTGYSQ